MSDPDDFDEQGVAHLPGAAVPFVSELEPLLADLPEDRAGIRLHGMDGLARLLASDRLGRYAAQRLGVNTTPVRAILFDKTEAANWNLGWHQDRTIAVREWATVSGFGPWSRKAAMVHVEPPFGLIERMVTLRIHLDAVDEDNAPLTVVLGSHRLGRLTEDRIEAVAAGHGALTCIAERGDVWLYRTAILHASPPAVRPRRRRVLQVDYSADTLPSPLKWLGVGSLEA